MDEKENIKDISIALFDSAGTKLVNFDVKVQANQFLAECEHLKAGIYWCRKFNKEKVTEEEKVIIDRGGIIIKEIELDKNTNQSKISTSSWAKGVYFVNITANDKVIETIKLVLK